MATGAVYLVIAACIGYAFTANTYLFRYALARKSGWYSYLYVTSFGIALTFLGIAINRSIVDLPPGPFDRLWSDTLCTMGVALLGTLATNFLVDDAAAIERVWKDDLDRLLYQALKIDWAVQVTTESNAIYVGYVIDTIEPGTPRAFLTLLPLKSGYRDPHTLEERLTRDFRNVSEALETGDPLASRYALVLPISTIVSCALFDDPGSSDPHAG